MSKKMKLARVLSAALFAAILGLAGTASAVDFNGDGEDDYTVFRPILDGTPINGIWYTIPSGEDFSLLYDWGLNGDYPVSGPYTSTDDDNLVVWRPSNGIWYIRYDNEPNRQPFTLAQSFQWGLDGDIPVPCDRNGDGKNELTVWRPSNGTWYSRISTDGSDTYDTAEIQQWGLSTDTPVIGDYDGDGECDYTVYRPSEGNWYVILSSTNGAIGAVLPWGGGDGDIPVPGHYDSDDVLDFAVWRPSDGNWYIRTSTSGGLLSRTIQWGLNGDQPVPADFTGDGKTDIAVWRPSDGVWYVRTSDSNYATVLTPQQFGLSVDIAVGQYRGRDAD